MKQQHLALSYRKAIRAVLIKMYMEQAGYTQAVGFSCGNGNAALKTIGVDLLDISPRGTLLPNKWWRPDEVQKHFPKHFDVTSGHLPIYLLSELGKLLRLHVGHLDAGVEYQVPSGSGETVVALKLVYPDVNFTAVYSSTDAATLYEKEAPLNAVVTAMGINIVIV